MTAPIISRLNERIQDKSLLKHPFYQDWQAGKLTLDDLKIYAAQYHHFEANFPTILSAIHSRCPDRATRQIILSNLWDEEHGPRNHRTLWLQFASALGLSEQDVENTELLPETRSLVDTLQEIASTRPYQDGLAAIFAYEQQVPAIAEEKLRGLRDLYGLDTNEATEFFNLHMGLDVEHSEGEAQGIANAVNGGGQSETGVLDALDRSLDAWWSLLDGVHRTCAEAKV